MRHEKRERLKKKRRKNDGRSRGKIFGNGASVSGQKVEVKGILPYDAGRMPAEEWNRPLVPVSVIRPEKEKTGGERPEEKALSPERQQSS